MFTTLFFLSRFFFFSDESDNNESGSGPSGTCTFPFCYGKSSGRGSGVGSGVFVLTGIKSIGDGEMVKCVFLRLESSQSVTLFRW